MCLDKLLKDVEITETVGYKVFDTIRGNLSTAVIYFEVEVGKEYEAESGMLSCFNSPSSYQRGFHIFLKIEDAKNYMEGLVENETCVIRKVSFRNVLAIGLDDDKLCVVAQYMTVLDGPKTIHNLYGKLVQNCQWKLICSSEQKSVIMEYLKSMKDDPNYLSYAISEEAIKDEDCT